MGLHRLTDSTEFVDPDTGHWRAGAEDLEEMFYVTIPGRVEPFFAQPVTVMLFNVALP